MKQRVSDYIADFLAQKGITQVFTVVGGGAMYLNDSFGHHSKLHCLYNHHEQACAIAAEGYARINNEMAVVCVTSGPGAINALNGVAGAYMDSVPMLVISGQTKSSLTVKASGLKLRTLGNQEFNIMSAIGEMTKYGEMIMEPEKIRYVLEKAYHLAVAGRPGPCWIDIPLDIQGAMVETCELEGYEPEETIAEPGKNVIQKVIERIRQAERPVIYAGNGIRLSGGYKVFRELVERLQVPVVTCWNSIDLIENDNELFVGRGGTMGDRAGNFAVQNSDLVLAVGTRLNIYQVGYQVETWAREAYTIVVDIDPEELKKPTVRIDLPICADAEVFMEKLIQEIPIGVSERKNKWIEQCNLWKKKYPVYSSAKEMDEDCVDVYRFIHELSSSLEPDEITVVANGSASVVGSQTYVINHNQRFIMNCGLSSMGYDLPAAIGACMANGRKRIICIAGDGSIQMNLQELQTIVTNKLPIVIFVINNQGYHQIRLTQNNIFKSKLVGVGPESGDLGFPDFEKIAFAYGIPYYSCRNDSEISGIIGQVLREQGCVLCEVFVSVKQPYEPKSATKRLPDGTLVSPPLEDMAPFLPKEELRENMIINMIE